MITVKGIYNKKILLETLYYAQGSSINKKRYFAACLFFLLLILYSKSNKTNIDDYMLLVLIICLIYFISLLYYIMIYKVSLKRMKVLYNQSEFIVETIFEDNQITQKINSSKEKNLSYEDILYYKKLNDQFIIYFPAKTILNVIVDTHSPQGQQIENLLKKKKIPLKDKYL